MASFKKLMGGMARGGINAFKPVAPTSPTGKPPPGDGTIGPDGKLRPNAGSNFSNSLLQSPFSSVAGKMGGGSTKMGG